MSWPPLLSRPRRHGQHPRQLPAGRSSDRRRAARSVRLGSSGDIEFRRHSTHLAHRPWGLQTDNAAGGISNTVEELAASEWAPCARVLRNREEIISGAAERLRPVGDTRHEFWPPGSSGSCGAADRYHVPGTRSQSAVCGPARRLRPPHEAAAQPAHAEGALSLSPIR